MAATASRHPVLQAVAAAYGQLDDVLILTTNYSAVESLGMGMEVRVQHQVIRLGSWAYCGGSAYEHKSAGTHLAVAINGTYAGCFYLPSTLVPGMEKLMTNLPTGLATTVITGDVAASEAFLDPLKQRRNDLKVHTSQNPEDKLNKVLAWEQGGLPTLMIGDGLNDGPALQAASIGIAVVAAGSGFAPAADAVAHRNHLIHLPEWLCVARGTLRSVRIALLLSLVYNVIGVGLAAAGLLTPLFAAAFMPLSSLSVVALAVILTQWQGKAVIRSSK
jgi:Cu+-exporting ATPase